MPGIQKGGKSVAITLNPKKQTLVELNKLIAQIAGKAGCEACGRLAYLKLEFMGDPAPELAGLDVLSVIENVGGH